MQIARLVDWGSSRMLQAFVITFGEGLEAFLIVAIALAFLKKTGSAQLIPPVRLGIAASAFTSVLAAWLFSGAENQALWQGVFALAAAVGVAMLTMHIWRTARHIDGWRNHDRLPSSRRPIAWVAMFLFTLLILSRQGMETVLLMATVIFQVGALDITLAAAGGIVIAVLVAWLWSPYGRHVNLGLFFQVTALCLSIIVAQLLLDGVNQLANARLLAGSNALQWATEFFGPDGAYGQYFVYLVAAVPLAWLLVAIFSAHGKASDGRVAHVGR
jgi:high-affinity iron transporter